MPQSNASLSRRLQRWICEEAGEGAVSAFLDPVEASLQTLGYDPTDAIRGAEFERVKAKLRAADITPTLMRQSVREAEQARTEGRTTREWIQGVQRRVQSGAAVDQTFQMAMRLFDGEPERQRAMLETPPDPCEVFAYRLVLLEVGGGSGLAARTEQRRLACGKLPRN